MLKVQEYARYRHLNRLKYFKNLLSMFFSPIGFTMGIFVLLSTGLLIYLIINNENLILGVGLQSLALIFLALNSRRTRFILGFTITSVISMLSIAFFTDEGIISSVVNYYPGYIINGLVPSCVVFLFKERYLRRGCEVRERSTSEHLIIDSIVESVCRIDNNGKIVYINRGFEGIRNIMKDIAGLDIREGDNIFDIIQAAKFSKNELKSRVMEGINSILYDKNLLPFYHEFYWQGETERAWFTLTARPLRESESGAVVSIIDSTRRKTVEHQLTESKRKYIRLIESLPDAVIILVKDKIVYANQVCSNIFGYSRPEDVKGRSVYEFIHGHYHDAVRERINIVQRDLGKIPLMEEKIVTTTGEEIDVEVSSTLYYYDETPASLVVLRDITERKQAELLKKDIEENQRLLREAYEYDKLKNEFIANISHELRTPINVILSGLQLIQSKPSEVLEEENGIRFAKYTDMMKQNCYRLLRLINNLIDISKIEAGFFEIKMKNYNIISIIEDITISVVDYIENHSIDLEFDTEVEERVLACDPDKIERIMLNLLSNAVKFTPPGGKITVNILDREKFIEIHVKDTGIGIPEDKKYLLFQRFKQINKSLIKSNQGSGIGLSLVKSLVELHSGTIRAESEAGIGTDFIITLPARIVEEDIHNLDESMNAQSKIERINIEFSDIYSL